MQWKHLDSPPPQKARVQPSAGKVMLTVFWDQDGVVMTDFLAKGTTITGAYYASLSMKLREAIKIKRRGKISKCILLLQDFGFSIYWEKSSLSPQSCLEYLGIWWDPHG